ncbi:MAG: TonB-dependent receptor [Candidatus Acidiferrales bacterium]
MRKWNSLRIVALLTLLMLWVSAAHAQYTTGSIQGTVLDPGGSVVPNATVTLRNRSTNVTLTFKTGPSGIYLFPALTPDPYEISAQAPGFSQTAVRISAVASQTLTQNLKLALQGQTTKITVQANVTPLNTTNAQVSVISTAAMVNDLPTNHSGSGLVIYAPGVQPMYNPRGGSLVKLSGAQTGQIASNGGRAEYSNVTLDFTDANDWEFGGFALGVTPYPDFIQQFNVLTTNVTAEYGTKSNGEIQMITKSGTNDWHGEADEYLQNNYFNARNYNDTTGRAARTDINNYGFDMGGPVQRDKFWLFGGWHQNRNIGGGATYDAAVPSLSARATATDPGIISIMNQYYPTTGLIPTSNPNIDLYPVNFASPGKGYQFMIRGDYRFSNANALSIRYFHNTSNFTLPFVGSLVSFANEGSLITALDNNANITDTWEVNPTTVNQLRLGYARSYGFLPPQMPTPGPYFLVAGLGAFGEYGGFPQGRIFNVYQANDVLSTVKGAHELKLGFDMRIIQDNSFNAGTAPNFTRGFFIFPSESAFLNAQPSSYFQLFGPAGLPFRTKLFGTFIQDDYRMLPTLTLNMGLRWEFQGALTVANGNYSLLDTHLPGNIGVAGSGVLGSFKVGNPLVQHNPFNFGPRLGFAWNPGAGNLVVRGGYGIYYDSFDFTPLADQGRTSPPVAINGILTNFSGGNTISALLAGNAPWQTQNAAQVAAGGFGTATNFGSIVTTDPTMKNPYSQQWDLFLDYKLPFSMLASAGYVGSKGTHLAALIPANNYNPALAPAPATSTADQQARISQFQSAQAAEGTGALRIDPRFAQVNLITGAADSHYNSLQFMLQKQMSYGLMLQASYTWSKSIDDASTAYPTQDYTGDGVPQYTTDLSKSKAVSNFDIPQRIAVTSLWNLPFFNHRQGMVSRFLLQGWQFGTVNDWQIGVPINIFSGPVTVTPSGGGAPVTITDVNMDGATQGGEAPDNTLANCSVGGPGLTLPGSFTSHATYSQPLLGHAGTCGRNIARQPGFLNFNWSIAKQFRLKESGPRGSGPWTFTLRMEAYDVFNTPQFYVASVNNLLVSNPTTFGQLTPLPQRHLELVGIFSW